MSNDATEQERTRCLKLLDLYYQDFVASSDKMMPSLWCRIRNQIAMGVEPDEAGFGDQLLDDEDGDDSPN